jgi:triosephosphate isomerase
LVFATGKLQYGRKPMRRKIVIGNWKMNGDSRSNPQLLQEFASRWQGTLTEVVVCPPFPYLVQAAQELAHSDVMVGAQDASCFDSGAHTGDVSAAMLADTGCSHVILGHSERRQFHAESDELVVSKAQAALRSGLTPVICVGETAEERDAGQALARVARQLQPILAQLSIEQLVQSTIAYEPLWAIGTGKTATPEQAQEVHEHIRAQLKAAATQVRILYGGSVNSENAAALFAQKDIDGALVGGASLKANDFLAICRAAEESGAREV